MYIINMILCDLCGSCAGVCPRDCIEIFNNHAYIDNNECIECGKCFRVCPVAAVEECGEEE